MERKNGRMEEGWRGRMERRKGRKERKGGVESRSSAYIYAIDECGWVRHPKVK